MGNEQGTVRHFEKEPVVCPERNRLSIALAFAAGSGMDGMPTAGTSQSLAAPPQLLPAPGVTSGMQCGNNCSVQWK